MQWTTIGGAERSGDSYAAKKVATGFGDTGARSGGDFAGYPLIEYTLKLPMKDGSFASIAAAEQTIRDIAYSPDWEANTEELFQVPPDSIKSAGSGIFYEINKGGGIVATGPRGPVPFWAPWSGSGEAPIDVFRPEKMHRLLVLGGCADISRELATKILRPCALMELGQRIGIAAAKEAVAATAAVNPRVASEKAELAPNSAIAEVLSGVRPASATSRRSNSPQRAIPVLGEYDVVVVGGGTGGAPAGIAAARNKAKVLVLEYLHGLGGVGTQGLITKYYWGYRKGFTAEIPGGESWHPFEKAEWFRTTLRKAGGEIWFGAMGCGAYVESGAVRGVVVATPQGRGVVLAKVVIDSTGNADIAAAAGAHHRQHRR